MQLNNQELHKFLSEKGICSLYHANSVATSITYITQNGLLSRGFVEANGLFQTPQSSDDIDQRFGVWNDIFLDTTDLHKHFKRQNFYGPVSFQFSIDFLIKENYEIWITKDNPIRWTEEMTDNERYFTSVQELREEWDNSELHVKMVTIRNLSTPALFPYIERITVDDPNVKVGTLSFYDKMVLGLKSVATGTSLLQKFTRRRCVAGCYCKSNYLYQVKVSDLKRLFLPQDF